MLSENFLAYKHSISVLSSILAIFTVGWGLFISMGRQEPSHIVKAFPIIRFERFDASRHALMIAVSNPGTSPMEIDRTELIYQTNNEYAKYAYHLRQFANKPLVLDPDDTILVPLLTMTVNDFRTLSDGFWGIFAFRSPHQQHNYCLRHYFRNPE